MLKNKRLENEKPFYIDCDDTLVMWDLSQYPDLPRIQMDCYGPVTLIPNQKNVNLVKKFHKLGYAIIIWSATGAEWAEAVGKTLGLDEIVSLYLTKPRYYLDDLPAQEMMGTRLWRDPVKGGSSFVEKEVSEIEE